MPDLTSLPELWTGVARFAITVILAGVAIRVGDALINRLVMGSKKSRPILISDSRAKTLIGLLRSVLRYTVGAAIVISVLDLVGIDTRALLGGAAVFGVAVGFGAQNLVRDVIAGFFIIYEGQYDVGDYITASGLSGTVEEVGLRTTRLRDWNGDVHVIPNGLIEKTTNKSRAGSRALVEVPLAHDVDARKAIEIMSGVCNKVKSEFPSIIEGPTVLGITNITPTAVVIQVWARTKPLDNWQVERELRLRIVEELRGGGVDLAKVLSLQVRRDPHE